MRLKDVALDGIGDSSGQGTDGNGRGCDDLKWRVFFEVMGPFGILLLLVVDHGGVASERTES